MTPDTLLRWFRLLVARTWTYARKADPGRPPVDPEVEKLVLKMMTENPSWGSDRIVGALANLNYEISDSTVNNIRKRNGIPPAPNRGCHTTWRQFLKAHWEGLIAADFFTTEVLGRNGLITFNMLFVIELRPHLVHVRGTTVSPNGQWMKQMARQLTDGMDGFAGGKTHLSTDRDTKYCEGFRQILEAVGMKLVLCPPCVPQCNAIAERFVRSIKTDCLRRLIFLCEEHLRSAVSSFVAHYNGFRNHQGLENKPLTPQFLPVEGEISPTWRVRPPVQLIFATQVIDFRARGSSQRVRTGCGEDLPCSQARADVHNRQSLCFCATRRERKTARSPAITAWWKTGGWLAGGWCNATLCIWARSTTASKRPGARPSRFLRRAKPARRRWRSSRRIGSARWPTRPSCGFV